MRPDALIRQIIDLTGYRMEGLTLIQGSQDNVKTGYDAAEQMVVSAARQINDHEAVYVGVGLPTVAALLAKNTHAPNCTIVVENGILRTGVYSLPGGTDTVGVQFWGDTSDGWARVIVDGAEVWSGSTYGSDANYPGNAFVKYLEISGLEQEIHTVRVENTGVAGAGGGDDVTIFFFGLGNTGDGGSMPAQGSQADSGGQVPEASVSGAAGDFSFYAVYDRLVDTDRNNVRIYHVALSGDGEKLVFSGQNA